MPLAGNGEGRCLPLDNTTNVITVTEEATMVSFEQIVEWFDKGFGTVKGASADADFITHKLKKVNERVHYVEKPLMYAWTAGRFAALDSIRHAEYVARQSVVNADKARKSYEFTQTDKRLMEELETVCERVIQYVAVSECSTVMTDIMYQMYILFVERGTMEDVYKAFPNVKRDALYQRKKRGIDFMRKHGGMSEELAKYVHHVSTCRTQRRLHQKESVR